MSTQHEFSYPKVIEIRPMPAAHNRRRVSKPTQRMLVVASLVRCPENGPWAHGGKGT